MRRGFLILLLALVALPIAVHPALAQGRGRRPFLADALHRTDEHIALAAGALAGQMRGDAAAELASARELQDHARTAFAGPERPRIVLDLTLRARDHADRAMAMVRGLPDPDRVLAQLEQTRDGLDRAGELLRDCPDDRARAQLHEAQDMQGLADAAARGERYLAALQLTFGARERVTRALRVCGREEDLPTSSARALERTDQVVARARNALGAPGPGPAGDALRRAESMQAQALEQQRASQHDAAMRSTFNARASALRALRLSTGHR